MAEGGYKVPGEEISLSADQEEVLRLLCEEFLSVKKIARRRGTGVQAVYHIIRKLQEKGFLDAKMMGGIKGGGTFIPPPSSTYVSDGTFLGKRFRLHGQEFRVGLLDKKGLLGDPKVGTTLSLGSWKVQVWKDCLVLHCGLSFIGPDVDSIAGESLAALDLVLRRLERDLKVSLLKDRAMNIRQVKAHYSEMHNELAVEMEAQGEKIAVKDPKDGKVWLLIDNSFNLHEIETIHPETAQEDMRDVVGRVFNDWRSGSVPVPAQMMSQMNDWLMRVEGQIMMVSKLQEVSVRQISILMDVLIPKSDVPAGKKDDTLKKEDVGWYIG